MCLVFLVWVTGIFTGIQFHRVSRRDSAQVVTPFVQVGTYPTRNFATLGPLLLRPPFTGASVQSFELPLTPPFNLPAPGRRQCLYVVLTDFADTCVFTKQSLGPFLCGLLRLPTRRGSPTTGSPSPEVTGTFCRVPSPRITRAP